MPSSSATVLVRNEIDKEFELMQRRQDNKSTKKHPKKKTKATKVVGANFKLASCSAKESRAKEEEDKRKRLVEGLALLTKKKEKVAGKSAAAILKRNDRIKRVKRSVEKEEEEEAKVFTDEDFAAWANAPFINSKVGKKKKKSEEEDDF